MAIRICKLRCPRCGSGRLFRSFFVREERCNHCEWQYERGEGFWVGGSEVHMFASYGVSVVLFIPMLVILGSTPAAQAAAILGHVVFSLALFRLSRAVFIGFDYYLDPDPVAPDDDDGGNEGVPAKPIPRAPNQSAAVPRRRPAIHAARARNPRVRHRAECAEDAEAR